MLINIESINFISYGLWLLFFFSLTLLLIRKDLWGVFDPIIVYSIYITINVVNIFYFNQNKGNIYSSAFVLFATFFFVFGLKSTKKQKRLRKNPNYKGPTIFGTKYLLFVTILFLIVTIVFYFNKVGFGLLTNQVSADIKTRITMNGLGVFKYISWVSHLLMVPLLLHAYFIHNMKRTVLFGTVFYILSLVVFNFSKAGFVLIIFDIGIVLYYFKKNLNMRVISTKTMILISVLGLFPALIVLAGYEQQYGIPFYKYLIIRIIDTGGGSYNYFINQGHNAFNDMDFIEKLRYFFDTLLSVFRLKEWENPNRMAMITRYLTGTFQLGYGQNPFMFLDGHFLFGSFGVLYTFLLGKLINIIRHLNVDVILFFILNKIVLTIIVDPDIAQAYIVSLILVTPFLVLLYLFVRSIDKRVSTSFSIKGLKSR